jgi:hypothetical protein
MSIEASQGVFSESQGANTESEFDLGFISGVYESSMGSSYSEIFIDGNALRSLPFKANGVYEADFNIDITDDALELIRVSRETNGYKIEIINTLENEESEIVNVDNMVINVKNNQLAGYNYEKEEGEVSIIATYENDEKGRSRLSSIRGESENDNESSYGFILNNSNVGYNLIFTENGREGIVIHQGFENTATMSGLVMGVRSEKEFNLTGEETFEDLAEEFGLEENAFQGYLENAFGIFKDNIGNFQNSSVEDFIEIVVAVDFPQIEFREANFEDKLGYRLIAEQYEKNRLEDENRILKNTIQSRLSPTTPPRAIPPAGYQQFQDYLNP